MNNPYLTALRVKSPKNRKGDSRKKLKGKKSSFVNGSETERGRTKGKGKKGERTQLPNIFLNTEENRFGYEHKQYNMEESKSSQHTHPDGSQTERKWNASDIPEKSAGQTEALIGSIGIPKSSITAVLKHPKKNTSEKLMEMMATYARLGGNMKAKSPRRRRVKPRPKVAWNDSTTTPVVDNGKKTSNEKQHIGTNSDTAHGHRHDTRHNEDVQGSQEPLTLHSPREKKPKSPCSQDKGSSTPRQYNSLISTSMTSNSTSPRKGASETVKRGKNLPKSSKSAHRKCPGSISPINKSSGPECETGDSVSKEWRGRNNAESEEETRRHERMREALRQQVESTRTARDGAKVERILRNKSRENQLKRLSSRLEQSKAVLENQSPAPSNPSSPMQSPHRVGSSRKLNNQDTNNIDGSSEVPFQRQGSSQRVQNKGSYSPHVSPYQDVRGIAPQSISRGLSITSVESRPETLRRQSTIKSSTVKRQSLTEKQKSPYEYPVSPRRQSSSRSMKRTTPSSQTTPRSLKAGSQPSTATGDRQGNCKLDSDKKSTVKTSEVESETKDKESAKESLHSTSAPSSVSSTSISHPDATINDCPSSTTDYIVNPLHESGHRTEICSDAELRESAESTSNCLATSELHADDSSCNATSGSLKNEKVTVRSSASGSVSGSLPRSRNTESRHKPMDTTVNQSEFSSGPAPHSYESGGSTTPLKVDYCGTNASEKSLSSQKVEEDGGRRSVNEKDSAESATPQTVDCIEINHTADTVGSCHANQRLTNNSSSSPNTSVPLNSFAFAASPTTVAPISPNALNNETSAVESKSQPPRVLVVAPPSNRNPGHSHLRKNEKEAPLSAKGEKSQGNKSYNGFSEQHVVSLNADLDTDDLVVTSTSESTEALVPVGKDVDKSDHVTEPLHRDDLTRESEEKAHGDEEECEFVPSSKSMSASKQGVVVGNERIQSGDSEPPITHPTLISQFSETERGGVSKSASSDMLSECDYESGVDKASHDQKPSENSDSQGLKASTPSLSNELNDSNKGKQQATQDASPSTCNHAKKMGEETYKGGKSVAKDDPPDCKTESEINGDSRPLELTSTPETKMKDHVNDDSVVVHSNRSSGMTTNLLPTSAEHLHQSAPDDGARSKVEVSSISSVKSHIEEESRSTKGVMETPSAIASSNEVVSESDNSNLERDKFECSYPAVNSEAHSELPVQSEETTGNDDGSEVLLTKKESETSKDSDSKTAASEVPSNSYSRTEKNIGPNQNVEDNAVVEGNVATINPTGERVCDGDINKQSQSSYIVPISPKDSVQSDILHATPVPTSLSGSSGAECGAVRSDIEVDRDERTEKDSFNDDKNDGETDDDESSENEEENDESEEEEARETNRIAEVLTMLAVQNPTLASKSSPVATSPRMRNRRHSTTSNDFSAVQTRSSIFMNAVELQHKQMEFDDDMHKKDDPNSPVQNSHRKTSISSKGLEEKQSLSPARLSSIRSMLLGNDGSHSGRGSLSGANATNSPPDSPYGSPSSPLRQTLRSLTHRNRTSSVKLNGNESDDEDEHPTNTDLDAAEEPPASPKIASILLMRGSRKHRRGHTSIELGRNSLFLQNPTPGEERELVSPLEEGSLNSAGLPSHRRHRSAAHLSNARSREVGGINVSELGSVALERKEISSEAEHLPSVAEVDSSCDDDDDIIEEASPMPENVAEDESLSEKKRRKKHKKKKDKDKEKKKKKKHKNKKHKHREHDKEKKEKKEKHKRNKGKGHKRKSTGAQDMFSNVNAQQEYLMKQMRAARPVEGHWFKEEMVETPKGNLKTLNRDAVNASKTDRGRFIQHA